jgi:cysteine-rich repeat protein
VWSEQPAVAAPPIATSQTTASLGQVVACDPAKLGEYPIAEDGNPNRKGPDLQNISTNFHVTKSLEILISAINKAIARLEDFQTQVGDDEQTGYCRCVGGTGNPSCETGTYFPNLPGVTLAECDAFCDPAQNTALPTSCGPGRELWLPNAIFKDEAAQKQFALELVGFLDELQAFTSSDFYNDVIAALTAAGSGLANLNDILQRLSCWVDLFSEGYHLGAYSEQRPDLHLCVGYYGHGAYAQMGSGGEWNIGGRYTSHNLSGTHRAQMRTGGFGITAFGKNLTLVPNLEMNVQIDGYRIFDACKPLGIESLADPVVCGTPPTFPLIWVGSGPAPSGTIDMSQIDIFSLVDRAEVQTLDTSGDGILQASEFLLTTYTPFTYTSAADGQTYTWPRSDVVSWANASGFDPSFERQIASVMSAGLNINPELDPIERALPNIVIAPGVFATPILRLGAGAEWKHEAFELRSRLQDTINQNLPAAAQLDTVDFERSMHDLQAPDLTADNRVSAYVTPGVELLLTVGIPLGQWVQLGIFASIGLDVELRPGANGGLVDLSRALTSALNHSNPPADADCSPVLSSSIAYACSDRTYDNYEPGSDPKTTYACDQGDEKNACCVTVDWLRRVDGSDVYQQRVVCLDAWTGVKEDTCACDPAGSADDCLLAFKPFMPAATHDALAAVFADASVSAEELTPEWKSGKSCEECAKDKSCPDPSTHSAYPSECAAHGYCVTKDAMGADVTTYDVLRSQCEGDWFAYACRPYANTEVTGWQGPGCHPLNQGFPSACGCLQDADCGGAGELCNTTTHACESAGSPVVCTCDPAAPTCTGGRTCVDGACVASCVSGSCGSSYACVADLCVAPANIPFAEQIVWQAANIDAPMHSVETYAITDFKLTTILDAALQIGMRIKLFKKWKEFLLFSWADAWDLFSTWKSKFQPGLEAQYQEHCDPKNGVVVNHQPGTATGPGCSGFDDFVCRYWNASSPSWSQYDDPSELIAACKPQLEIDVENPPAPTGGDFATGLTDLLGFGSSVGESVWNASQLCVGEQTLVQWMNNGFDTNTVCTYTGNQAGVVQTTFPCVDVAQYTMQIWGCANAPVAPWVSALPPGVAVAPTYVSSATAMSVIQLNQLVDPDTGALLVPLAFPLNAQALLWVAQAEACFEAAEASDQRCECTTSSDCASAQTCNAGACMQGSVAAQCNFVSVGGTLASTSLHVCCGDGVVQSGEQCDDGNNNGGDGCSFECKKEERGACCADGCSDGLSGRDCLEKGGSFFAASTCASINSCGQIETGACVLENGQCKSPISAEACKVSGGSFVAKCETRPLQKRRN